MSARPRTAGRRGERAVAALAVTAVGALLVHFTLSFLHVAPANPVSHRYQNLIDGYVQPYFLQNWHLFAPEPVNTDRGVLARAEIRTPDGTTITPYLDLTSPELDMVEGHAAPSRAARQVSGALQMYDEAVRQLTKTGAGPKTQETRAPVTGRKDQEAPNPPAEADVRIGPDTPPVLARFYDRTVDQLGSLALDGLQRRYGTPIHIEAVQLRVVEHTFPRFSQRDDPGMGEVAYRTLPWWDAEEVRSA
ncbi:hypothetical protein E4198_24655 [Streptomyces sp. RKND-216]|uniref:DUF5819 family protein n=1 Tax=Streptomyces sp. RKND-216 TaxID=2562581 RepID=UPI00109E056A|nr:DUF5819 family protein [Streptomyces sp. RKND-216]THA23377.1 hypothetical protein E4198_00250 [Streptomyces sp. RKND-216]THA27417.1 hypothetical protein E4198_24655 [Streptomyces sp. RKND-216]